jgi:hypothetical protein
MNFQFFWTLDTLLLRGDKFWSLVPWKKMKRMDFDGRSRAAFAFIQLKLFHLQLIVFTLLLVKRSKPLSLSLSLTKPTLTHNLSLCLLCFRFVPFIFLFIIFFVSQLKKRSIKLDDEELCVIACLNLAKGYWWVRVDKEWAGLVKINLH